MAYLKGPNHDGVFEGIAIPGTQYVKPIGKQKVWLTFVAGNGNIRSVKFFENQLSPEDFVQEGDGPSRLVGRSGFAFSVRKIGI